MDAKAEATIRGMIRRCYEYAEHFGLECYWRLRNKVVLARVSTGKGEQEVL